MTANNAPVASPAHPEDESQRVTIETATQGRQKDVFSDLIEKSFWQLPKHFSLPKPDKIKTPAVIFGMTGAVFVALPATIFRLLGFSAWMIANSLWVIQGKKVNDFYLIALFGFYFVTAVMGFAGLLPEVVL